MNFAQILALQPVAKADAPLYVKRPLKNSGEFIEWAKGEGFETTLPESDLHVTIVYSKKPIAYHAAPYVLGSLRASGGKREVKPLGDGGAVVLAFESEKLQERWKQFLDAGASWDFEGYHPHVTITWKAPEGLDLAKVKPFEGTLEFGPEVHEPLDLDFKDKVVEKLDFSAVFKRNPYHDLEGRFTSKDNAVFGLHSPATPDEVVSLALPKEKADKYRAALKAQEDGWSVKSLSNVANSKNGDGTGGYTQERLEVHRKILDKLFEGYESKVSGTPTMKILGGRGGSGKSNFDSGNNPEVGVYHRDKYVVLDPDHIKELLPDYRPDQAARVHKESGDILRKAARRARALRVNTVLDVTMRSSPVDWINMFKESGYRVEAHYMHRPVLQAAISAVQRWDKSTTLTDIHGVTKTFDHGRLVPVSVVLGNTHNELNFERIKSKVDAFSRYDNVGHNHNPKLVEKKGKVHKYDFSRVLKSNPYHDSQGKFTSKDKAFEGGHQKVMAATSLMSGFPSKNSVTHRVSTEGYQLHEAVHQFKDVKGAVENFPWVAGNYVGEGFKITDSKYLKEGEAHVSLHGNKVVVTSMTGKDTTVGKSVQEYHSEHATLVAAKAEAKKAGSFVTKGSEKAMHLDSTSMLLTHNQEFGSAQKATDGLPALKEAYTKMGLTIVPEALLPGEVSITKKSAAMYAVKTVVAKKGSVQSIAPEVEAPKAKTPAEVFEAPKKMTAAQKKAEAKKEAAVSKLMADYTSNQLEGLNLKVQGKHSAGEQKLKKQLTLEKNLVSAGFTPEEVAAHMKKAEVAFEAHVAAKVEELAQAHLEFTKIKGKLSYTTYPGHWKATSHSSEYFIGTKEEVDAMNAEHTAIAMKVQAAEIDAGPYLYGKAFQAANDKQEALISGLKGTMKSLGKSNAHLGKVTPEFEEELQPHVKALKDLGVSKEVVDKAVMSAKLEVELGTPSTKEMALAALSEYATEYGKVTHFNNVSSYSENAWIKPSNEAYELAKAKALKAQADLVEHGVPLYEASEMLKKHKNKGASEGMEYLYSVMGKAKEAKEALQDAIHKKMLLAEMGDSTRDQDKKVAAAVKELEGLKMPQAIIDTLHSQASDSFQEKKKELVNTAKLKIQGLMGSYHASAVGKGADHEESVSKKLHLEAELKPYKKLIPQEELDQMDATAKVSAVKAKELMDKLSNGTGTVSTDYDTRIFHALTDGSVEGQKFAEIHTQRIATLPDKHKHTLTQYTGGLYTDVNRAAGQYGKALMEGKPLPKLDQETVDHIKRMDAAFAEMPLGMDVRLRRNMPQKYLWEQFGISLEQANELTEEQAQKLVGRVYKETAFRSTSMDLNFDSCFSSEASKTGKASLYIRAGKDVKGLRVKSISQHSSEQEVVLARGTTYVIRGIKKGKASWDTPWTLEVDAVGTFPDKIGG